MSDVTRYAAHADWSDGESLPVPRIRLVFARHGESPWNAAGVLQGHDGPGLSARGIAQANALAQELGARFADVRLLLSSDLDRAKQTAERIATKLPDAELRFDARLRESDIGSWSGK